jgi:hypothetical protein
MIQWRLVVGNKDYAVSDSGRVIRWRPGKPTLPLSELVPFKTSKGYLRVDIKYAGKRCVRRVHALVCEAFIGDRPEGHEINHKDGNKENNSLDNLEYCTSSQNARHAFANGLRKVQYQNLRRGNVAIAI